MKIPALFAAFALVCSAQFRISFSGQGSEALRQIAGKAIPGVQLVLANVCAADGPSDLPVDAIYESAIEHGLVPQGAEIGEAELTRTAGLNWRNLLVEFGLAGVGAVGGFGASGTIAMPRRVAGALIFGHMVFDEEKDKIKGRAPNPSAVISAFIQGDVLRVNGCRHGYMTVNYGSKKPFAVGPFPLNWSTPARQVQPTVQQSAVQQPVVQPAVQQFPKISTALASYVPPPTAQVINPHNCEPTYDVHKWVCIFE